MSLPVAARVWAVGCAVVFLCCREQTENRVLLDTRWTPPPSRLRRPIRARRGRRERQRLHMLRLSYQCPRQTILPSPNHESASTPGQVSQRAWLFAFEAGPLPTRPLWCSRRGRKVLRTLDSRICEQDESTALAAIETALKLVSNILDHPSEPKFRKFRANNPGISKKLLSCPGGQDLLVALGFRVKVIEFEECWIADETSLMMRSLAEASQALDRYRELTRVKLERNAKLRREKLANMNEERGTPLAQ